MSEEHTGKSFEEKIARVLAYKKSKRYPEGMSKGQKFTLHRLAAKYSLEGDVLYHSSKGRKREVVQTMKEAKQCFRRYHSIIIGGHQGVRKTIVSMTARYYWPGMTNDIAAWVAQCPDCQKVGKELNVDTTLKSIKVSTPWELVGIGLIGPLPETKKGNRYILTATDYFSRWVEAFAVPDKLADTVADKIFEVISRFGCPYRILTDCDAEFNNELNQHLCKIFEIQRTFISPYHPQSNGLAKSTNKSIKSALQKYVDPSGTDWDYFLNGILFSLRAKINMTTGFSPSRIVLGFEPRFPDQFPKDYVVPKETEVNDQVVKKYIMDMDATKKAAAAMALKYIEKAQERRRQQYAKRKQSKCGETTFQAGQAVMLLNARRKTRKGGSLQPTYRGPYKVSSIVGKRVKLEDWHGKPLVTLYSISHLKPFQGLEAADAENTEEEGMEMENPAVLPAKDIAAEDMVEINSNGCHSTHVRGDRDVVNAVDDAAEETPSEGVVENCADECHSTPDSIARCFEAVPFHHHGDVEDKVVIEVGEDKEWFQKVQLIQARCDKERLETKVGATKLCGSSFAGPKPGGWLGDEVQCDSCGHIFPAFSTE